MIVEHNPLIAVVDDEPRALSQLAADLESVFPDAEIRTFDSCQKFRDSFSMADFELLNLLVADGVLPEAESGWDLLADLKARWPHVKRVLVSNKMSVPDLEFAINKSTPDGFLQKTLPLSGDAKAVLKALLITERERFPVSSARAEALAAGLSGVPSGDRSAAAVYQSTIIDILRFVFYPQLQAGRTEMAISGGASRPDAVFYNAAESGPLFDLKLAGSVPVVPIEVKNRESLDAATFRQIDSYVRDFNAGVGFVVFRGDLKKRYRQQLELIRNRGRQVLLLTDEILVSLMYEKISAMRGSKSWRLPVDNALQRAVLMLW